MTRKLTISDSRLKRNALKLIATQQQWPRPSHHNSDFEHYNRVEQSAIMQLASPALLFTSVMSRL